MFGSCVLLGKLCLGALFEFFGGVGFYSNAVWSVW